MPPLPSNIPKVACDFSAAQRALGKSDPVMRGLIRRHGPCGLVPQARRAPFESLARAIAHQQLHGAAAQTILRRFIALTPGSRFPTAKQVLQLDPALMRGAGFSQAKVAALRDLAEKTIKGIVPSNRIIGELSDDEIITRLTQVRGVGQWTVEMLLIFQLGRPDVLPADDFGVRNGFRIAYGHEAMPRPRDLVAYGERWRPHRTLASWFLWRAADTPAANIKV